MKKDILAAITFLTTGLLFYLVQADGAPRTTLSSGDECGVVETIAVEEGVPEGTGEDFFKIPRTRDS